MGAVVGGAGGGGRGERANSLAEPLPQQPRPPGPAGGGRGAAAALAAGDDAAPPAPTEKNNATSSPGGGGGGGGGGASSSSSSSSSAAGSGNAAETISYSAERIIGNGSFGVVFQASVVETGEIVAIKKVLQDKRFKNRELQIMRQLVKDGHSNIVGLKHCFYSQVSVCLVCWLLRGEAFPFLWLLVLREGVWFRWGGGGYSRCGFGRRAASFSSVADETMAILFVIDFFGSQFYNLDLY